MTPYSVRRRPRLAGRAKEKISDDPVFRRVGFADAARALAAWAVGLAVVGPLVVNPRRPGRHNPRVVRRRRKEYDLMTKPRADYRQPSTGKAVAA